MKTNSPLLRRFFSITFILCLLSACGGSSNGTSTEEGRTGEGSLENGSTETDNTETDSTETDSTETDSTETDSTETDSGDAGSNYILEFSSLDYVAVPENSTSVGMITASTDDPVGLQYRISGGTDQSYFVIDNESGALAFKTTPDYEIPADVDANNGYIVQVSATNSVTEIDLLLTVTVTNINDNTPVLDINLQPSVLENERQIMEVAATDADGDSLIYSLSGGVDKDYFYIDSSTGELAFVTAPDFEIPLDSDRNNQYSVDVTVADGLNSSSETILVTVLDVIESEFGLQSRPINSSCVISGPPNLSSSVELNLVFSDLVFQKPIALRESPTVEGRWYVAEQRGQIKTFLTDDTSSTVFANLTSIVDSSENEMGLLGFAFHPNFSTNQFIFLYYSTPGGTGDHQSVISRFTATSDTALDLNSELEIMRIDQPDWNHNGGNILFGSDGYLYIGLGDGGGGGDQNDYAQNILSLLGKMLRINVDVVSNGNNYSIPVDNPYVGLTGRDEIFAVGLRNPWRWSFDKLTGDLIAGDVGQNEWEEVDVITRGGNYGWRCYEGTHRYNTTECQPQSSYDAPIQEYGRGDGFSVTGGYVYRGSTMPFLYGTYVYTDFGSGPIWGITDPTGADPINGELVSANFFISSFAEDNAGELYVLSFSNGQIYRLDPASSGSTDTFPNLLSETGCIDLTNRLSMASGLIPYDINAPFWSDGAEKERWIALADESQITIEGSGDWSFPPNSVLVKNFDLNGRRIETRLLARHEDGSWGGYSYEWNDTQTDAGLVLGGKVALKENQSYIFPSSTDCMICHTTVAGIALGPEIQQLNRNFIYPSTGISANQLTTLESIGLFTAALSDHHSNLARLTSPTDESASFHDRARAYLHTNCSQCHREDGPTNVSLNFYSGVADSGMNICNITPTHQIGEADAVMAPGNAAGSSMVLRMSCRDGDINCNNGDEMPPLGSTLVDFDGVDIVSSWIDSLTECP